MAHRLKKSPLLYLLPFSLNPRTLRSPSQHCEPNQAQAKVFFFWAVCSTPFRTHYLPMGTAHDTPPKGSTDRRILQPAHGHHRFFPGRAPVPKLFRGLRLLPKSYFSVLLLCGAFGADCKCHAGVSGTGFIYGRPPACPVTCDAFI